MKRILAFLLVFVLVGAVALGIRLGLRAQEKKKREANYQVALRSYSQVLKPGMTRKEVEAYLPGKNLAFRQMCCVDAMEQSRRKSWDDLVKIGEETPPWFCGEKNVYIAFQFIDDGRQQTSGWEADDRDTLKAITIYPQLENCL